MSRPSLATHCKQTRTGSRKGLDTRLLLQSHCMCIYIYRTSVHVSACVHVYPRYTHLLFEESRNYLRSSTPWLVAHFLENSAIQLQCSLIANSLTDINAAYILLLPLSSVKITQMYSVPCFTVIPDFILPLVFLDSARVLLSAV